MFVVFATIIGVNLAQSFQNMCVNYKVLSNIEVAAYILQMALGDDSFNEQAINFEAFTSVYSHRISYWVAQYKKIQLHYFTHMCSVYNNKWDLIKRQVFNSFLSS